MLLCGEPTALHSALHNGTLHWEFTPNQFIFICFWWNRSRYFLDVTGSISKALCITQNLRLSVSLFQPLLSCLTYALFIHSMYVHTTVTYQIEMHLSGHKSSKFTLGLILSIPESACLVKCEAPLWNGLSACLGSWGWERQSCSALGDWRWWHTRRGPACIQSTH